MKCKSCKKKLSYTLIDLISSPIANSYSNHKYEIQKWYPLKIMICSDCWLVQVVNNVSEKEIFKDNYPYFSSISKSLLEHSKLYCEKVYKRFFKYEKNIKILEIASNDGYLLQYFKNKKNISKILGIEPTPQAAKLAKKKNINTICKFFSYKLSKKYKNFDLIIANNVIAHVPDINDFVKGIKNSLSSKGVATIEFQYLVNLIKKNQFDNIYHEHFFYYSMISINKVLERNGLKIFDVENINTQGGSLRLFIKHKKNIKFLITNNVNKVMKNELDLSVNSTKFYKNFAQKVYSKKNSFLKLLLKIKEKNKIIIGYGAAAKGNTMINLCGIKNDLINYVVDKNSYKQKKFLPGSCIPIISDNMIKKIKPDYIIIFPWNIADEISKSLSYTRKWNCKFIVYQPNIKIF